MTLVSKLADSLKAFDRKVWPAHRVALEPAAADSLARRNLIVADVGSAEGPEERWLGIRKWIRFVNFEPNPRPDATQDEKTFSFPVGLWSSKTRRTLQITEHPDSSSLYPANMEVFNDFLSKEGMALAGTAEIELDTLDNCVSTRPELSPDFLKIDVEGADLEVLRGSQQALQSTVMGLRVETAWLELRRGGPLVAEINAFLLERGFVMFHLSRVHWIRNNALHGFTSQPQLIWGDAVYFLRREDFLKKLSQAPEKDRESLLVRFVVILLCHGVHDYAVEIVDAARAKGSISDSFAQSVKTSVIKSADRSVFYFVWSFVGLLFSLAVFLVCLPVPGARIRGRYYLKQRSGRLFHELWRWSALAGRPANSSLEDPFV